MFPVLSEGVAVRDRDCSFSQPLDRVAITAENEAYELSKSLTDLLCTADGVHDVNYFRSEFGDDTESVIQQLVSAGIVTLRRSSQTNSAHLRQFLRVSELVASCRSAIWHLTRRCNQHCGHCYYLYQKEENNDFSPDEIFAIVENLAGIGTEHVTLTGGEVLSSPKSLFLAMEALTAACIPFSVNTNATYRLGPFIERFLESPYARMVQTSIDGHSDTHDAGRGLRGSFGRTMSNIQLMSDAGIFVRVVSMVDPTWQSPSVAIDLARQLSAAGVRDWLIELPSTTGRCREEPPPRASGELLEFARGLLSFFEEGNHGFYRASFNQVFDWPTATPVQKTLSDPSCYHDLGLLSFGPEGLSFCSMFREQFGPEWKDFHNPAKPMKAAWNSIASARVNHTIGSNPACRACDMFQWCQGGCPGMYNGTDNFSGCDPHSRTLAHLKRSLSLGRGEHAQAVLG